MATKTLQQVYSDCVITAKQTSPFTVQKGNLYRWKGRVVSSVTAKLELKCTPFFGLAIIDSSALIPCLLVDPIAAAGKLLNLLDQTIIIRDPQFSVEVVATGSKQYDSVHLYLEPSNIKLPDTGPNITVAPSQINCDKSTLDNFNFTIIPQKISPAILTSKCEVLCLILITVIFYEDDDRKKDDVWLVLKNDQVSWKDFLLPCRSYTVQLPSQDSYDEFKKYKTFHAIADKYLDLVHRQMMHHKDLIKTIAVSFLPENAQISSKLTLCEEISCNDWFSILDERLYKLKFASVYGIIKEINYLDSWNMMNCPWCDTPCGVDRPECDSGNEKTSQNAPKFKWSSVVSKSSDEIEDTIRFPTMKSNSTQEKIVGFGIRGGKINVQIAVQEVASGAMSYVFLKRWKMEQYPAGLAKGVTVCFTDVNVKRSRKNNLYFVNTPLTRILYLNVFDTLIDDSFLDWEYRFPWYNADNDKVWGTLELEMLAKMSIATKCLLCQGIYAQFRCPNVICANHRKDMKNASYEVTATARLLVRGNEGGNSLYLKNENVRTYLDIPEQIWRKLCMLSARSELVYSHYFNEISSEETDKVTMLLYMYCKHLRRKNRFHVFCKKFKGDTNEEKKYFCVALKKIDSQRIAVRRNLL